MHATIISGTLLSTYPFTMTSIFYELTKPGRRKKGGWILLFFAPWTAAFSLSIPVYWTYSYIEGSNEHGNQTTVCARVCNVNYLFVFCLNFAGNNFYCLGFVHGFAYRLSRIWVYFSVLQIRCPLSLHVLRFVTKILTAILKNNTFF